MKHYVFYAGLLYGEYSDFSALQHSRCLSDSPEIYNGSYIYSFPKYPDSTYSGWWRANWTPVLLEDVPKELLLLKLLLT